MTHRGPGEPLTQPIGEDVPLDAFYVEKGEGGRVLACAHCTMRFEERSKLDSAIEHYRSHVRAPVTEEVEAETSVVPKTSKAPAVEKPKVQRQKQEGRLSHREDPKGFVWFTFGLPESEWKKVKSADLGGQSIRPFIRDQWEMAVKDHDLPQEPTNEKLKKEGIWISKEMANDIIRREEKGDFNFDYWLIAMFNRWLKKHH